MRSLFLLILATLCLLAATLAAASSSTANVPVRVLSTEYTVNEKSRLRGDNKLATEGFNANDEERTIGAALAGMKIEVKKIWATIIERLYKLWRDWKRKV
ncbi:hypothetical protein F441_00376 [Phytophthora nicotianae CJ01A1]|uniref:RxLR effector protein n=1 Tax=Phytophthora nicotianae CJ01A1 TaxID=1317063 RepID=W2XXG7_PHYNI|nr:hypothetical protein F441_00376 [Phytophthora nicotianae CJ01A1]